MSQSTVSLKQVHAILRHQVESLLADPSLAHQLPPLLLWGPPGVGKSSIVRAVCEELGIAFVDIRLSQREPVDLRGLPVPREDRVDWLLSGEWPRDPDSAGIILFDEITAVDRSLQVAAYELLLDRRLGDLYQVPDRWYLCGAGNREEDGAAALGLSSALANRFCHLEVEAALEPWLRWAQERALHPQVIGFLRYRPGAFFDNSADLQRGWPSPRSWERVAHQLTLADQVGLDADALAPIIEGLVGPGVAAEFAAFRSWSGAMVDAEAMLRAETQIQIPERADQCYALCAALVYHLWRSPERERAQRLDRFLEITLHLSSDFATLALIDAIGGSEGATGEKGLQILGHPRFFEWAEKHGTALGQYLPNASLAAGEPA
ncbi:AAA family ATPase [Halorhodospira halochloris]|uniref:AAA family ATPase n=1 Tax=Halorhodospira halochloris TaxID=1052 RepID=UPI001EE8A53D|nr:AAA family ATPase [Halorhodospira halochloris]MCG5549220.1 AAA family ATPase [Halorhodospira halochloris]